VQAKTAKDLRMKETLLRGAEEAFTVGIPFRGTILFLPIP
jgi:hypothetical protein